MTMHRIIQEKRKELGLTQEQIAEYLCVSAAAVSKWENGITCPDIGLLSPLARLLKTDLNTLLGFHQDLPVQEIGCFCKELSHIAQNDIAAAFVHAETKLREFPHQEELLLNITILLDAMLLQSDVDESERNLLDKKVAAWYARLVGSADSRISNGANYMLVSRHIREGKLELAQSVLDTIQDRGEMLSALPDKLMLQISIYLKQNKAELAARELERALYLAVNRVQLLLLKLVEAELQAGEKSIADTIAKKAQQIAELLDMWKYTGYAAQVQMIANEKDADKMITLLSQMLEALTVPWDVSLSPLYHRIASEMKKTDSQQILSMLLRSLETDPDCDELRSRQEFADLIAKYKTV